MTEENKTKNVNLDKEFNTIRKSFKRINSNMKDDVVGLKTLLVAIKNNIIIKNQLLNLNNDETSDHLTLYNEIFTNFPKLKETVFKKLIYNYKQIVVKLEELNNNLKEEIKIINRTMINSEGIKIILQILFENKYYENYEKENSHVLIELTRVEKELVKFNQIILKSDYLIKNSINYYENESKLILKEVKIIYEEFNL